MLFVFAPAREQAFVAPKADHPCVLTPTRNQAESNYIKLLQGIFLFLSRSPGLPRENFYAIPTRFSLAEIPPTG